MIRPYTLPTDTHVFERGWLSSNNVLFVGSSGTALVDSGYSSHALQTLALVQNKLAGRPLDLLLNTHLHSDHCGGNALLQATFTDVQTLIPPGNAHAVASWNQDALTYKATGQHCDRFDFAATLAVGSSMLLGNHEWQIHAAPGHDPDSVVLFEPVTRTLISADALWENGFGVVFPELEGIDAFDAVGASIDLCESLAPRIIIPGHGPVFTDVSAAIARARSRLAYLRSGDRHINHSLYAAKVLLKFFLLERQRVTQTEAMTWLSEMPYFKRLQPNLAAHLASEGIEVGETPVNAVCSWLLQTLCKSGAAKTEGDFVVNV